MWTLLSISKKEVEDEGSKSQRRRQFVWNFTTQSLLSLRMIILFILLLSELTSFNRQITVNAQQSSNQYYNPSNQYSTPSTYEDYLSNQNTAGTGSINNINDNSFNPIDRNRYHRVHQSDLDNENDGGGFSRGKSAYNIKSAFLESTSFLTYAKEPTYFIVASKMVRPGLIYQVAINLLQTQYPMTVHASISCDGVQISSDAKNVKEGVPETLLMRVPPTSINGVYKLRVEGVYQNIYGGFAFLNETDLHFSQRSMTIFIQTDKPLYMQGETVRFRTIPITTELRGFDNAIDVYMLDPNRNIVRRWLSRYLSYSDVLLCH